MSEVLTIAAAEYQDEITRLRTEHPSWKASKPEWDFFLSAYEGGSGFTTAENLFKHARENQDDYNDRIKRAHNLNYCEPILDFFTNFIFSEPIDRNADSSDSAFFNEFIKNVDMKGSTIDDFMREVSDDMQIFGTSYIQVDAPPIPEGLVLTKQNEKDSGIRPYWVLIKPEEIIDWVTDDFQRYTYIRRRQYKDIFFNGKRHSVEMYTEIYPDRYVISLVEVKGGKGELLTDPAVLPNKLGVIPIKVVRYKTSKKDPDIGLSFLRDYAYNNREIMNLTSLLQEFLYRQAFNVLAKEVDMTVPILEQTEGVVGTSNVMEVPKGAAMPQYISPPSEPAKFIQDERGRIKNEMYLRAAQDTLTELFNGEKASGFSQAQQFSKTVPFISSRAEILERTEMGLMDLTYKFRSAEWNGKIQYKDRYEITNLTDALTQLLIIFKDFQIPSETFVKEELKRIVGQYDSKLPSDILAKIMKEIDKMDFKKWQDKINPKPTSPGAQQKPKQAGMGAGDMAAMADMNQQSAGATNKLRTDKTKN